MKERTVCGETSVEQTVGVRVGPGIGHCFFSCNVLVQDYESKGPVSQLCGCVIMQMI